MSSSVPSCPFFSQKWRSRQAASKQVSQKSAVKTKAPVVEGAELIGITVPKEADFSGWYQQVLTKGDMLDYYDISGCYILKVRSTPIPSIAKTTDEKTPALVLLHLGKGAEVL